MADPILSLETITRDAREAAEDCLPPTACPYPDEWEASKHWLCAYRARANELHNLTAA